MIRRLLVGGGKTFGRSGMKMERGGREKNQPERGEGKGKGSLKRTFVGEHIGLGSRF